MRKEHCKWRTILVVASSRTHRTGLVVLVLCTLVPLGPGPRAQRASTLESSRNEGKSDFWENLAHPGRREFKKALKKGRRLYKAAQDLKDTIDTNSYRSPAGKLRRDYLMREYRSTLRRALAQLKRATRAAPQEAEGHYNYARALYHTDHNKKAIKAFNRARRLAKRYANDHDIVFSLALAHTKLGHYEKAIAEYDRIERILVTRTSGSMRYSDSLRRSRSMSHSNAAEMLMTMGRLEEAIRRYHEGLAVAVPIRGYANREELKKQAYWGLAVAYDRDEQVSKGLEYARRAVSGQPRMRYLTSSSVFFVPPGEIHYYFAMGYLAQGNVEQSRKNWQLFVDKLPRDQWAHRARAHLAELSGKQQPSVASKKKQAPAPGTTRRDPAASDRSSAEYRIRSYLPPISKCYDKLLKRDRDASGRLKVAILISVKGKVKRANVVYSTVGDRGLSRCVLGQVRKIQFRRLRTGKSLKMEYAFQFSPRR